MNQIMKLNKYEVWVSLGCSEEEQSLPQPVLFDVQIHFSQNVKGVITDHLQDTVDYVALTEIIYKVATEKSFHLVEHLCFLVHQHIETYLKKNKIHGYFQTEVVKLRAPVRSLQGGVSFSCQSELQY